MCANALIEWVAWDVWQCHGSRAGYVGCMAVPRFSHRARGICGSATVPARGINLAQGMGDKEGATPSLNCLPFLGHKKWEVRLYA